MRYIIIIITTQMAPNTNPKSTCQIQYTRRNEESTTLWSCSIPFLLPFMADDIHILFWDPP